MRFSRPALVCLLLAALAPCAAPAGADDVPAVRFDAPGARVDAGEGHVVLSWVVEPADAAPEGLEYEVQLVRSDTFDGPERRYLGGNRALFVSGLEEGSHWFRVRAVAADGRAGAWSDELEVDVAYPSAGYVAFLMAVGAVVLLATVAMIAFGHRRTETALAASEADREGPA